MHPAIRHAVLTAKFNLRIGLPHLNEDRRQLWSQRITLAEGPCPSDFADATDHVIAAMLPA